MIVHYITEFPLKRGVYLHCVTFDLFVCLFIYLFIHLFIQIMYVYLFFGGGEVGIVFAVLWGGYSTLIYRIEESEYSILLWHIKLSLVEMKPPHEY